MSKRKLIIGLLTTTLIIGGIAIAGYFVWKTFFSNKAESNNQDSNNSNIFKTIDLSPKFENSKSAIEISYIDVGQADSILIRTSTDGTFKDYDNTYNILIDAGDYKSQSNAPAADWNSNRDNYVEGQINTPNFNQKLNNYLKFKDLETDKIDMFIASHADADHIGGLNDAINNYAKKNESIVLGFANNEKETLSWKNVLNVVKSNSLTYIDPFLEEGINTKMFNNILGDYNKLYDIEPNTTLIKWSDQMFFDYICPSVDYNPNGANETNESSINNYLIWNKYRFLFSGDSEGKTHDDLVDTLKNNTKISPNGNIVPVDFYKSAHHGSTTHNSNNVPFLKQILDNDSKIIISQNDNRLYGGTPTFQDDSIKNIMNAFNNIVPSNNSGQTPPIYSTQDLGDIVIKLDNNTILENDLVIENFVRGSNNLWTLPNSKEFSSNNSKNFSKYNDWFKKTPI